jgi:hypothetical protein
MANEEEGEMACLEIFCQGTMKVDEKVAKAYSKPQ